MRALQATRVSAEDEALALKIREGLQALNAAVAEAQAAGLDVDIEKMERWEIGLGRSSVFSVTVRRPIQ